LAANAVRGKAGRRCRKNDKGKGKTTRKRGMRKDFQKNKGSHTGEGHSERCDTHGASFSGFNCRSEKERLEGNVGKAGNYCLLSESLDFAKAVKIKV
jgi:hypothetical protein